MNKYLIMGIVTFSLMATTAYALNDTSSNNDFVNEPMIYNQNCPYHDGSEECPYYDETTGSHACPNSENRNYRHNHGGNRSSYARHTECPRYNR